jgi:hypothetical protein
MLARSPIRKNIAVVGTGISGMAAAWLLSQRHEVTVFEQDRRVGGHSNTVTVDTPGGAVAVDTGFIVYNERTYPNLTALFAHLDVSTAPSEMSFSVSLDGGRLEYSGSGLAGLLAQKRNLLRPRFWAMLRDLVRFYRDAPGDLAAADASGATLGAYLDAGGYGEAFRRDHLLPMAAAIWSAPAGAMSAFPAASFIRFFDNHGLLSLRDRPQWRHVVGGSRTYVDRLTRDYADRIRLGAPVAGIHRDADSVRIRDRSGQVQLFDDVVIAAHADQALAMLANPTPSERRLLGAFRYGRNTAVLHSDTRLMPRRRAVWSSWNNMGHASSTSPPTVTYWMNRLQRIPGDEPFFVTLNPQGEPRDVWRTETYDHPVFDTAAIAAQAQLWSLQGERKTWFCGAYFGAGFHEDGLQAGLAVAEALGGVRRPWSVPEESSRIVVHSTAADRASRLAA